MQQPRSTPFVAPVRRGALSLVLTAALCALAAPASAQTDVVVVNSIPITINAAQWSEIVQQSALAQQNLETLTNMANEQLKHSMQVTDMPVVQLDETYEKVADVIKGANTISFMTADADQAFRDKYPQYTDALQDQFKASGQSEYDFYSNRVKSLQTDYNDSVARQLKSIGIVMNSMTSDKAIIDQLLAKSQSAEGMLQALQVANAIAAQSAYHLQRLQLLIAMTQNSQLAWQSYTQQIAMEDSSRKATAEANRKARAASLDTQIKQMTTQALTKVPGDGWSQYVPPASSGNGYGGKTVGSNGSSGTPCSFWNGVMQSCN